ncbi:hypothetical protein [Actinoallomurus iriomotensis]|uniref:Uncharacterized protein n=1 Tax=Actinoallomurus iriomotensis TaxID=478107 RepID=A0A9W6S8F5_9ACTN|nr:hypothetical protein [Actinoallomurus iriomotensis]GLY87612.1 hypothetical protein Airi02_055410 [Actinoallomurus iriomotensis]
MFLLPQEMAGLANPADLCGDVERRWIQLPADGAAQGVRFTLLPKARDDVREELHNKKAVRRAAATRKLTSDESFEDGLFAPPDSLF